MIVLQRLLNADGQRFHVAAGHAAVRMQSLVYHHHVAGFIEDLVVVHRQPAANVNEAIFLGAHPGAIGVVAEFLEDISDGVSAYPSSRSWMKKAFSAMRVASR